MRGFTKEWRPKLIIMHSDGASYASYAQEFGGEEKGIYSSMSANEWAEILPQPDWTRSRAPIQPPHHTKSS